MAERKVERAQKEMHELLAETEEDIAQKAERVFSTYRETLAKKKDENRRSAEKEAERIRAEGVAQAEAIKRKVRWNKKTAIKYIVDVVLGEDA